MTHFLKACGWFLAAAIVVFSVVCVLLLCISPGFRPAFYFLGIIAFVGGFGGLVWLVGTFVWAIVSCGIDDLRRK